jgi:phage FluMu protein Com
MSNPVAYWSLSLDVKCPHCKNDVDLITTPDFWDGRRFQACEQDTSQTTNVDVFCPECSEEFQVDFAY